MLKLWRLTIVCRKIVCKCFPASTLAKNVHVRHLGNELIFNVYGNIKDMKAVVFDCGISWRGLFSYMNPQLHEPHFLIHLVYTLINTEKWNTFLTTTFSSVYWQYIHRDIDRVLTCLDVTFMKISFENICTCQIAITKMHLTSKKVKQ